MPIKTADNRAPQFFRSFKEHPASVGESYFEHMMFAAKFSARLAFAAFAALIHAICPPLFEHTAGNQIRALYNIMEARSNVDK